jgi:hypothetical protein
MQLPDQTDPKDPSRTQFTPDLNICRILNGMWQVSGGHGKINPSTQAIDQDV